MDLTLRRFSAKTESQSGRQSEALKTMMKVKGENMKHIDKNGKKWELNEIGDDHLENIINLIKRKCVEGVTLRSGGGSSPEDYWYDEDYLYGKKAFKHLNGPKYLEELNRRRGVLTVRDILEK